MLRNRNRNRNRNKQLAVFIAMAPETWLVAEVGAFRGVPDLG